MVEIDLEFNSIAPNPTNAQIIFQEILTHQIDILYIDVTQYTQEVLQLCRILMRHNITATIPTIALLDRYAKPAEIKNAILTGVPFAHIKSPELHDVVYDPIAILDPKLISEPQYALANADDEVEASEIARINYINAQSMAIEFSRSMAKGSEFYLKNNFLAKFMPSQKVMVADITDEGLYYNQNYRLTLHYMFMDEDDLSVDSSTNEVCPPKQEQINSKKLGLHKWIQANKSESKSKNTKILIINKDSTLFSESDKSFDKYPYVIRYQPFLIDPSAEVRKFLPNVIAFEFEGRIEGEDLDSEEIEIAKDWVHPLQDEYFNCLESMKEMINGIKEMKNYDPIIIIFNHAENSANVLKEKFNYENIMVTPTNFSLAMLLSFAEKYEEKTTQVAEIVEAVKVGNKEIELDNIYFSKNDPNSLVLIPYDMTVLKLKEHEFTFKTSTELEIGTVFTIKAPFDLYATVVEHTPDTEKQSGKESQRALVHGIDEIKRKDLRQYINSVFFRAKEEKKKAELEAFENTNQKALEARDAAEKKKQQDAEAEAKKEEEKASESSEETVDEPTEPENQD